ncbi:MAG TPA: ABC transporter ATP-binding protein [Candidatus Thermoplasmatota archaeon]|nr:ABC transporter ATP-binding protein [Candidatus Thermoplasmatota archaeon]
MLRVEHLRRSWPDGWTLADVSFEVAPGDLAAIVGPSGSGKTTVLRLVAGLETPEAGRVLVDGRDVTREAPEARHLAYVFQEGALFPHLDVRRNVAFGLRVRGLDASRADEALALVGLEGFSARRVQALSGGERSRVALARALAPVLAGAAPRVLLLDEPFSALDRPLREDLRRAVSSLHRRLGLTTVLVTHDREEALTLADRIVVLRGGRVVEHGPAEQLYSRPSRAFTARFLGSANVLSPDEARALGGPRVAEDLTLAVPISAVRAGPGEGAVVAEAGWASGRAVVESRGVRLVAEDARRDLRAGAVVRLEIDWSEGRALEE